METDSFFHQLFKQLPQTYFEMLGMPGEQARDYRFDSVEIKKSLRLDGLFVPTRQGLPVHFVEVQFRPSATFYADLFAKVFLFLQANNAQYDWRAAAIFEARRHEPKFLDPYEDLLRSTRVTRIYPNEYTMLADPPLGLGLLQLVTAPDNVVKDLVGRLVYKADHQINRDLGDKVIELTEELLLRKFTQLDREEVRAMFGLHDLRKSKVWHEAHETGIEKGIEKGREEGIEKGREQGKQLAVRELVRKCLGKGMSVKQISELMDLPVKDVRRMGR